jgi:hypothetical protein
VCVAGVRADANLPELGPMVISVFPLGARQAETLGVQILGRNLNGTHDITFARPDIKAEVLSSDFFSVRARISVGPKVPVGLHDYRLCTPSGTHVGVFHVGSLPRLNEVEPNNDLQHAQAITLPMMIDGIIEANDYDVFRFHADLRRDGHARRLPSGQHDHNSMLLAASPLPRASGSALWLEN